VDEGLLRRMNDALLHRGPDEGGVRAEPGVGLAMRRLAIIDVAAGHQPLSNEDGTVWVVFNGEIYNFESLRGELEKKGHVFRTRSDTETIVHLYEEEGPTCVARLRGMFAFALWDRPRRRLILARDRFGKKPLYYFEKNGVLAWASELQALHLHPDFPREMDPEALDMYLSLQYIPSPRTIYRGVRKLAPAHRLVIEKGNLTVERYWDLPVNPVESPMDLAEAKTEIRRRLSSAVKDRLISEVPLGAFLSGGVDSSAVVAEMSALSSRPVKTFSIGFEEQDFSELGYARLTARRFATEHTEFVVTPDMADVLPRLARHYGEPFGDASALPTYYVARATRRHVTVALNGDGGDENFAGYERYMVLRVLEAARRVPPSLWRAGAGLLSLFPDQDTARGLLRKARRFFEAASLTDPAVRHLSTVRFFAESDKEKLYTPEFRARLGGGGAEGYLRGFFDKFRDLPFPQRNLAVDLETYLPECLMTKVDVASMAVSLEARSPFLDHEFVEFVAGLPGRWKLRGVRGTKWILKEAYRGVLPDQILDRPKMGFGIPLGRWFRGPLKGLFQETVLSESARAWGVFRPGALAALWEDHQSGRRDHGYKLWALLMLELWREGEPL
jgi:asparagine synthase (glutamine-hydrolysing)